MVKDACLSQKSFRTVYKPAGVPVFPLHDGTGTDSILERIYAEEPSRKEIEWPSGFEGGIVHRLDRSTSGAVLVANDLTTLQNIREVFQARQFVKTYRFIASKHVPWDVHYCDRMIAHQKGRKGRMVVQRGANTPHRGKWYAARTDFRRIDGPLFEAVISTGVMHQIRVHSAFLGIPILGDRIYGGGATPESAPDGVVFFLHHLGMTNGDVIGTSDIPLPAWAGP